MEHSLYFQCHSKLQIPNSIKKNPRVKLENSSVSAQTTRSCWVNRRPLQIMQLNWKSWKNWKIIMWKLVFLKIKKIRLTEQVHFDWGRQNTMYWVIWHLFGLVSMHNAYITSWLWSIVDIRTLSLEIWWLIHWSLSCSFNTFQTSAKKFIFIMIFFFFFFVCMKPPVTFNFGVTKQF